MQKVVVIGIGIVGAVTAYELAKRGFHVTMIDSKEQGRATAAAAGMVNPWTTKRRSKRWYELAVKGANYILSLQQQLIAVGEKEIGLSRTGVIHVDTIEDKLHEVYELVTERKKDAPEIGEIKLLDESAVRDAFPFVNDHYKGLYIEGASQLNGAQFTNALIRAAIKHGATWLDGKARFSNENGNVIEVDNDEIEAHIVVATNGIWMPSLLQGIGVTARITALHGEVIKIEANVNGEQMPALIGPHNLYMLPFTSNQFVIGSTHHKMEMDKLNPQPTVKGIHNILEKLTTVSSILEEATIVQIRAGIRPYTDNYLPLFGPLPSHEHIYVANGLGASGLSTGPMIGKQLAKMIANEPLDIDAGRYPVTDMI